MSMLFVYQTQAQIVFNTTQPIDTLIQDFVGSGVVVSNVIFTGGPQSIGSFNGSSSLGSSQGIVFSSGNIDSNMSMPSSAFLATSLNVAGDVDLMALVTGPTFDAAILEFDFVATYSTLLFDYVFASEEYNEFVGGSFNDVFAFFISGPGIIGKQNLALIPNTILPVSINNVNNGPTGAGPCMNCAYYHDNTNDTTVAFDGFTVPLTATYTLTPGLTYHLKLAVADVADQIFDTGVFLQKYSLRSSNTAAVYENILNRTNLFVYNNTLQINLAGNIKPQYTLYSVDGKKITEQTLKNTHSSFDLSTLPKGIYSVVLVGDGVSYAKKIAVE